MASKQTNKNSTKKSVNNKKNVNKNKVVNTKQTTKQKNIVTSKVDKEPQKSPKSKNTIIMKTLVFLGVLIFCFVLVYLMYHFFVANSNLKINMSTEKKMEYFKIEGNDELIITQKYVSDLSYSMRYDVSVFEVFKYKTQDIYKNLNDERILVMVEKSSLPNNCTKVTSPTEYNSCYVKIDDYTENHYFSMNDKVYKITIKTPGTSEYEEGIKVRINEMLKSFIINN